MISSAVPENERSSGQANKAIFAFVFVVAFIFNWFKRLNKAASAPTTARPTENGFFLLSFTLHFSAVYASFPTYCTAKRLLPKLFSSATALPSTSVSSAKEETNDVTTKAFCSVFISPPRTRHSKTVSAHLVAFSTGTSYLHSTSATFVSFW